MLEGPPQVVPVQSPSSYHGAIGNGRVLALISPDTSIEWLCLPRLDSPSCFARILDYRNGGTWRIEPATGSSEISLDYVENTNVLRSVHTTPDGTWEVVDFAPRLPQGWGVHAPDEFARIVRPLSGRPKLRVIFDPRPGYGLTPHSLESTPYGLRVVVPGQRLHLFSSLGSEVIAEGRSFTLDRLIWFLLSSSDRSELPTERSMLSDRTLTEQGWRRWIRTCALPGFADRSVVRSALCLKLLINEESGAVAAAGTTSIPEAIGTQRAWDYRYCWPRDAAFTVEALRRLGHLEEGSRLAQFIVRVATEGPLQPVYGIGGERALGETVLSHWSGYGGATPVRIGNAAHQQSQHDVLGEVLLCLDMLLLDVRTAESMIDTLWSVAERLVEEALSCVGTPDTGVWEFRTLPRLYTFSQSMLWVALHRGARIARQLGHAGHADRWRQAAFQQRKLVLDRGYSTTRGHFTQSFDGEFPDAANLLLPVMGLIDARDPRFLSTLDVYASLLTRNGLMLRYVNPDDFGDTSSAFVVCSFWWAEALALAGRLDQAIEVFERTVRYANPLGLLAEDIDPLTGQLLGNFPQAYSHVGVINAAMTIGRLLAAGNGTVRPWV